MRLIIIGAEVGTNSTINQIEEKIKQYNIRDKVLLPGTQYHIKKWLSAMDLFILPSLFEGLPLSAVEAQANGLPIVVSDTITKELDILGKAIYLSLDAPISEWVEGIESSLRLSRTSDTEVKQIFKEKGFDIKSQVKEIENILLGE